MVVDRLFPVSPVSFIALSQSYSLHVPLAHILPPCLWSPSLPFPRYRFRQHSPHYVIFFHPHDVPIPFQSSLRYLSGRLHYFRRSSYVFVPDFVFSCHFYYDIGDLCLRHAECVLVFIEFGAERNTVTSTLRRNKNNHVTFLNLYRYAVADYRSSDM